MPRMITKIEGRGNGIKTNVVNMVDIAKALGRPASYTTKYFGCELGAQSKFDEKTGTSHVNGAHDTAKLAGLLENFIKKFVQCYGCGNPETEIIITKSQMINLKCAACGFISEVDMRDKLTTFILKNPPEAKKGSKDKKAMRRAEKERLKEGEAADEEMKKLKKDAKKKAFSQADEKEAVDDDSDDDIQWQTDTSVSAAQQRIQEQLNAVTASMVMLSTNEEKPRSGKNSPARAGKPKANGHANGVDSGNPHQELVDEIKKIVKKGSPAGQFKSSLQTLTGTPNEIFDALLKPCLKELEKGFLKSPDAVKEVALVLKELYDNDVLEEEFIVEWYQKGLNGDNKGSPIWKNVKPFVEWLQSAESETEDE
ncbi:UNVERIFIED_CONTAM: putative eukaryotic translation initiation factor 5-2 [Sesamum angustifolium]|uniref:Eukaryotic translation initiation factor 5-2 n=1 Tax=Sesamum angustifolium TaxID=2727405 RepID=A0AAW2L5J3_9LAMI